MAFERARAVLLSRLCRESNGQSPFSKSAAARKRRHSPRVARSVGRHMEEHFSYSRHAAPSPSPPAPGPCPVESH